MDLSKGYENFYENRIKAIVLLSPAASIFSTESIQNVKTPIALVVSEKDEILPHREHGMKLIEYLGSYKLKLFQDNVSHYVFLNKVSDNGKKSMKPYLYEGEIEKNRFRVHKEVGEFIANFFKEKL